MTRPRPRAFLKAREGTTAIEFGFVIFPLLLFVFGTIEFGRLLWTREALRETAVSAARCMGILQSSCATKGAYDSAKTTTYIQNLALGWSVVVPASGVVLNPNTSCAGTPSFSEVTINYTFETAVPLLLGALKSFPVSVSACFPDQG